MLACIFPLVVLTALYHGCLGQSAVPSSVTVPYNHTITTTDYQDDSLQKILRSSNGTFLLQFGALPGQSNPHSLGIVHVSQTIVWYTYRDNNPGGYDNLGGTSTTLTLRQDGNLVITVEGNNVNVVVWSSGSAGRGVESMEMREEGNLVLLNSSKGIVWQSFDHPTDTLLQNQRLLPGDTLLARARNDYPSLGTNLMRLESHRLVSYVLYVDAEPYWQLESPDGRELAYATIVNGSIAVFDQSGNMVAFRGNTSVSSAGKLQRFLLDVDGNMRLSAYDNASSAWIQQLQVIEEACALPDDCGYYGLCIPGQGCACPPTFSLLVTLNGCVPPRALQCNSRYGNDFVKVPYASYFALPLASPPNLTFKACENLCTANCSCLGFFFAAEGGSTRPCLITDQMRTFSASIYGNYTQKYAYDLYVRVQGTPRSPLAIILGVCISVGVAVFCVLLWWFVRNRVKVAHAEEEEFLLEALPGLPPRFSYKELKIATKNFSQRLGGGSFGSVYEGELPDGSKIAVKQLEGAVQGKKEFHAEVATIGTVRHLNLVRLRGFCLERNHRLLVYEHMDKGSLDELLFKRKDKLSWEEKIEVALGVARALAYLHEGSPDCIIHCDVKPENILIDGEGVAKLSDFGLAKLMSRQQAWVETMVRGTRGYLAPEWVMGRARISDKADVYSYGVVLLEILAGRRNFERAEDGGSYFPEWALQRLGEEKANQASSGDAGGGGGDLDFRWLLEVEATSTNKDGNIDGNMDITTQKRRAVLVALWCVQEDPALRPPMSRVVRMLEGDVDVSLPPTPSPLSSQPPSSSTFSSFYVDRHATSEVTMPFLHRASRFLFASPSPPPKHMPASSM